MTGWEWLNAAGIALQVVGVLVAVVGVNRLHLDLMGSGILGAVWSDVVDGCRAVRRRKRPRRITGRAEMEMGPLVASAHGKFRFPSLPEGSSQTQIDFLYDKLVAVHSLVTDNRTWGEAEHQRIRDAVAQDVESLRADLGGVRQEVNHTRSSILGGQNGEGLRWTAVGLMMTTAGLGMSLLATFGAS